MLLTLDEAKAKLNNPAEQFNILQWTEKVLRPLADPTAYETLCQSEAFALTPEVFKQLYTTLKPFVDGGSAGHDKGHHLRDLLGISAIIGNDPTVAKAYPNDVVAGFLGGSFHDIACSVMARYRDNDAWLGHAEAGAWLFYQLTEDVLPGYIRRLTAYAIACHTHGLKPVTTKIGYVRMPWEDHLFLSMGKPVRIAVWLTRFADRLDTNGVTLLARHVAANLDSYIYNGQDFSGDKWYTINDKALGVLIKPEPVLDGTAPSALLHIARFAGSNDQSKVSPYNQHDATFPAMDRLITMKSRQAVKLGEVIGKGEVSLVDRAKKETLTGEDLFWSFLVKVSQSDEIESIHHDFSELWSHLTPEEQKKWIYGVKFAQKEYEDWVNRLKYNVNHSTLPLIRDLIPTVMEIVSLK